MMTNQMMTVQWNQNETLTINKHFWDMISCLDERMKVLDYLLNHRSGKYAIGTIKDISAGTGLSVSRVSSFLKTLEDKDIIKRKGQGVFILPPAMLPIEKKC